MKGKMSLGQGGRFEKLSKELKGEGVKNPKALAAFIGRKKYGKKKMQKWAKAGLHRALKEGK